MSRNFTYGEFDQGFIIPAEILPEDIEQEVELLKLEGKTPHRGIIAKRLLNENPELLFSWWIPNSAKKIEDIAEPMSALDYEKLVEFLYSTTIDVSIINNFLENPEDESVLQILVDALQIEGYLSKKQWKNTLPKEKSIRVLLLDYIQTHDEAMSYLHLVKYISSMHISKRPAEAVRISLKRLVQADQIKEVDGTYIAI